LATFFNTHLHLDWAPEFATGSQVTDNLQRRESASSHCVSHQFHASSGYIERCNSLKNLVSVKFSFHTSAGPSQSVDSTPAEGEGDTSKRKEEQQDPMCPSCKKGFSNSVIMFRASSHHFLFLSQLTPDDAVMKPCAHVTCKTCTESLVRPAKQCVVCDAQLSEKDIIELKREGSCRIQILLFPTF
jgi:Zinc finger, C3HC4 type (RING finger)